MSWCPPLDPPLIVTSPFGPRGDGHHNGTDYATRDAQGRPTTGLPVYAVTDAVVAEIGWDPERSGLWLALVGDDGWRYSYAHLSAVLVDEGTRVRCGEQIALSGDTGRVTGPHLHFGIRDASGRWLDPELITVIEGQAPSASPAGWGVALALGLGLLVLGRRR